MSILVSRRPGLHPLGKLVEIPHVRVADPTRDALRSLAAQAGVPVSEFVRVLLEERVHGVGHTSKVGEEARGRITGIGTACGPYIRTRAGE